MRGFPQLRFQKRHRICGRVLGAIALAAAMPAAGATCGLSVLGVAFGNYDFQTSQNLDGVGRITVTCDVSTSYTIALSPGFAGTFASRSMQNGPHQLTYNLYTDPAHISIWGDGTGGSTTVSGSGASVDHTVYGSVPAGQNPYVGSYSDSVTVTLTF